ncbi:CDP-archaeol synthase [Microvirga alba]|uniref:CDP-archaeol synthase n=1 Tax=Microvirga alba TaxID=2791025 RepID=A0A931BW64_9HYPH|nr:CDP-archaeol synthase [Microvirga alba]MBF9233927.1 CDP-archaeol synthase [Microvirga alba]
MIDPILIIRLLILLGVANGTPIFARKLFGNRFDTPLDCGVILRDGQPLLGVSKTIRGLFVSIVCTGTVAAVLNLGWRAGVVLATGSMLGDLFSSFVKRRLGFKVHAQAFALDQIPEALFPLLLLRRQLDLSGLDIALPIIAFVILEVLLSRLLFRLDIRDRPY